MISRDILQHTGLLAYLANCWRTAPRPILLKRRVASVDSLVSHPSQLSTLLKLPHIAQGNKVLTGFAQQAKLVPLGQAAVSTFLAACPLAYIPR